MYNLRIAYFGLLTGSVIAGVIAAKNRDQNYVWYAPLIALAAMVIFSLLCAAILHAIAKHSKSGSVKNV